MSDHAPAVEKVAGNGHGQRRAFFGIGGGAKLVEQHQRARVGEAREPIEVGDVRGEGGERGLDRLRVADVGQKRREDRKAGRCRRERAMPACAIIASSAVVFSVTVLPPVLGPLMMSWRCIGGEFQRERNNLWPPVARRCFSSSGWRAASRLQPIRRNGGRNAVVVAGKARAGQQAVDQREHARAFDERRARSRPPGA